jgi:hypothetical protein
MAIRDRRNKGTSETRLVHRDEEGLPGELAPRVRTKQYRLHRIDTPRKRLPALLSGHHL